jgi:hypothetical protein
MLEGRPTKQSTAMFLDGLPGSVAVSALVELAQPTEDPWPPVDESEPRGLPRLGPVFFENPYDPIGRNPVSWSSTGAQDMRAWAFQLDTSDDKRLADLQLPPSEQIKAIANEGLAHAYVLELTTPSMLAALLKDPSIRSVRVLDAGFDIARQQPVK